jgi:UDP-N-acetylmuramate--alanine ligase
MIAISQIRIAYFLGIGGIGMSAIARYFKTIGIEVHGYDKTSNDFTRSLEKEGFRIHYTENIEQIPSKIYNTRASIVLYTPAVPRDSIELNHLMSLNIPIFKRAEVLGLISKEAYTIAVAGTHGKTTTSSMIAYMLHTCGVNFSAFLGGISSNFGSNYIQQKDGVDLFDKPLMVVEADEYDRSFLQLSPDIAIVTSTDPDHLDIYNEHLEFKKTFVEFIQKIKPDGIAILNDHLDIESNGRTIKYGTYSSSDAIISKREIKEHHFSFHYGFNGIEAEVKNALPGFHNIDNAAAALTVCCLLNLPIETLARACSSFLGVKRRFEYLVKTDKYIVIDDYAHHPAAIIACIESVRALYPDKKLTGLFQPHLYSRTRDFGKEFALALDLLDECWLMDIYPARELPIEGINSEFLALKMKNNPTLIAKENILKKLKNEKPELLLIMGAGNIDQLLKPIKKLYL